MSNPFTVARDARVDLATNQVGYLPRASKHCVLPESGAAEFRVCRVETAQPAYVGPLHPREGDFGPAAVGDFSALQEPGVYYVSAGPSRSYPFRIGYDVYDDLMQKIVRYFALQRCGPSSTGYLSPCHMDDGVRLDNGRHQDVSGGWHDASDLRKWMAATIYGMIGLARLYEVLRPAWDQGQIMEELRWGNRYFLRMQEPDGYVMSHVGGDVLRHADSNRWTDNVVGAEGGVAVTIDPLPGGSSTPVTITGAKDDRVIQTAPLDRMGQYNFVIAQAATARLFAPSDPSYAATCLDAAERCLAWCRATEHEDDAGDLGAAIEVAVELYRATSRESYIALAAQLARRLADLQVREPIDRDIPLRGFYRTSPTNAAPYLDIWHGCWPLIALCDLLSAAPQHPDAPTWREGVAMYCGDYVSLLADRNAYGIAPYGLFEEDPGGGRRVGRYWYRYFMVPGDGWWVGINANLASTGVGLLRAARLLGEARWAALAQRQFDWILGSNPLSSSTVEGVGHNQPRQFVGREFSPPTPRLPGAVMNGLGGTMEDQPDPCHGSYHTAEYWTPMVAYTLWLAAELQQRSGMG